MWAIGEKKTHERSDPDNFTFLARGVDFKGIVTFDGTVRIDGRLEGEIHTTGTLIVGEHAVIKGLISAATVVTSGRINGTITTTDTIQMLKPGIVIGDLKTPAVSIEDGAHFHGLCDMGAHKWVEEGPGAEATVHDLAAHRGKLRSAEL
jgi:cytoskeletal protein CcmA (bactofilin family)